MKNRPLRPGQRLTGLSLKTSLLEAPNRTEDIVARKTIFVSDFSGEQMSDERQSATITLRYGDGRRGVVVADAHVDDKIVQDIAEAGRQQARRGRRPKTDT
jgi:hypothetical protein